MITEDTEYLSYANDIAYNSIKCNKYKNPVHQIVSAHSTDGPLVQCDAAHPVDRDLVQFVAAHPVDRDLVQFVVAHSVVRKWMLRGQHVLKIL